MAFDIFALTEVDDMEDIFWSLFDATQKDVHARELALACGRYYL